MTCAKYFLNITFCVFNRGISECLITGRTASKAVRSSIQRPTRISGHAHAESSRQERPGAQGPCDQRSNARDDAGARYREGAGAQGPSDLRLKRWRGALEWVAPAKLGALLAGGERRWQVWSGYAGYGGLAAGEVAILT